MHNWLRLRDYLLKIQESLSIITPATEKSGKALQSLIRWTQQVFFADVKRDLAAGRPVPTSWSKLSPFLRAAHLLRMGDRLNYAEVPNYGKYPFVLPISA